jgi:hypothetical protein
MSCLSWVLSGSFDLLFFFACGVLRATRSDSKDSKNTWRMGWMFSVVGEIDDMFKKKTEYF